MTSVSVTTRTTTDVALRILAGEKAAAITTPVLQYGPAKYDWRQLQRWRISESRLPPGSEIYFREPTLWDRYRWQIVVACGQWLFAQAAVHHRSVDASAVVVSISKSRLAVVRENWLTSIAIRPLVN